MTVPIPKLTPDEYLKIEREADFKSEYYRGEMFAMAGGSPKHSELAANLIGLLFNRLRGKGCKLYTSDLRVRTGASGLYTYPDISVVCGKPMYAADEGDVLTNPRVIFEVLSPSTSRASAEASTEGKDRGFKFQQYKQIESLQEYVLVSQTEPLVERFGRALGGAWTGYSEARGMDATLMLESLGIEIALAEIYQDIEFDS